MNLGDCRNGMRVDYRHPCGTRKTGTILETIDLTVLVKFDGDRMPHESVPPAWLSPVIAPGQCGVIG